MGLCCGVFSVLRCADFAGMWRSVLSSLCGGYEEMMLRAFF